jgi:hypothetical protein
MGDYSQHPPPTHPPKVGVPKKIKKIDATSTSGECIADGLGIMENGPREVENTNSA